jgi:hypothetical protein
MAGKPLNPYPEYLSTTPLSPGRNTGAPLNPYPDTVGSAYGGSNSSYSGADIKAVVHIYDKGRNAQKRIERLQRDLADAQKRLDSLTSRRATLTEKLKTTKQGTFLHFSQQQLRQTLTRQISQAREMVRDLPETIRRLAKDKPQVSTKVLAELQTISISTHRDKREVRACGTVYPKGWVRGPRQIAGSMIFTVFHEHVLWRLLEAETSDFDANLSTSALMDQLPPMDITLVFANELGQVSRQTLYGVEFVDEGQVMSIEDILTEMTVSFVARDLDPMRSVSKRKVDEDNLHLTQQVVATRASDLLLEQDYLTTKEKLSPFERFKRRRDPFL